MNESKAPGAALIGVMSTEDLIGMQNLSGHLVAPFHGSSLAGEATVNWQTSDQKLVNEEKTEQATKISYVDAFTPQKAATYARRMVKRETRRNGDQLNALERVGRKCGLTARSLRRSISRETKDPGISVSPAFELPTLTAALATLRRLAGHKSRTNR
ncbi:hypothetical protein U8C36_17675 [Sinorhizobium medicae]|uniref:hypothetical protein n=1 Tax=Sinorhizobium medicae TaxID=110321 RepID=UPI002AF6C2EA|nr:hypothetical protein [Sinorhizobium medicae]WQO51716.1 hypothetical protein U8C36_17675 [Sinorhizobium medicae]